MSKDIFDLDWTWVLYAGIILVIIGLIMQLQESINNAQAISLLGSVLLVVAGVIGGR